MTVQEWAVEISLHREAWIFQFFGTQALRICSIAPRTQEIKRGPSLHPRASSLNCNFSSYTLCQTTSMQKHQVKNPPTHRCWICFAWQFGYGWHHLSIRVKKLFQSMLAPVHCCPTNWNYLLSQHWTKRAKIVQWWCTWLKNRTLNVFEKAEKC